MPCSHNRQSQCQFVNHRQHSPRECSRSHFSCSRKAEKHNDTVGQKNLRPQKDVRLANESETTIQTCSHNVERWIPLDIQENLLAPPGANLSLTTQAETQVTLSFWSHQPSRSPLSPILPPFTTLQSTPRLGSAIDWPTMPAVPHFDKRSSARWSGRGSCHLFPWRPSSSIASLLCCFHLGCERWPPCSSPHTCHRKFSHSAPSTRLWTA